MPSTAVVIPPDALTALPPEDVAMVDATLSTLVDLRAAVEALEVNTPEDSVQLAQWQSIAATALKALKESHVTLNRPHNEKLDRLKRAFGPVKDALQQILDIGERKFLEFRRREDERARREEAERQEVIRKQEAERQRLEAQAAAAREKTAGMVAAGQVAGAILPTLPPQPEPPPPVRPPVRTVQTGGYGTMHSAKTWTVEVADLVAVAKARPDLLQLRKGEALKVRPTVAPEVEDFTHDGLRFFKEEAGRFRP